MRFGNWKLPNACPKVSSDPPLHLFLIYYVISGVARWVFWLIQTLATSPGVANMVLGIGVNKVRGNQLRSRGSKGAGQW